MKRFTKGNNNVFVMLVKIDFQYILLHETHKRFAKMRPKTPIDALIDQQTGYGKWRDEKEARVTIRIIKPIRYFKKRLGYDTSAEDKVIEGLKRILSQPTESR